MKSAGTGPETEPIAPVPGSWCTAAAAEDEAFSAVELLQGQSVNVLEAVGLQGLLPVDSFCTGLLSVLVAGAAWRPELALVEARLIDAVLPAALFFLRNVQFWTRATSPSACNECRMCQSLKQSVDQSLLADNPVWQHRCMYSFQETRYAKASQHSCSCCVLGCQLKQCIIHELVFDMLTCCHNQQVQSKSVVKQHIVTLSFKECGSAGMCSAALAFMQSQGDCVYSPAQQKWSTVRQQP